MQRGRGGRPTARGFVLTRLHARYDKASLGEDLVFRRADPIVGGREFVHKDGKLEEGSRPDARNNFQARYAIRHPWTGPIACENPVRGRWGGPPAGRTGDARPRAALDLAFARRGQVELRKLVKQDVPEIGLSLSAPRTGGGKTPEAVQRDAPRGKECGCGVIVGVAAAFFVGRRKR
jgi:hypothetical protein